MRISHLWLIDSAIEYAIAGLDHLDLPPSRKLQLGRQFHKREWIATAVQDIMQSPLRSLTMDDQERLTGRVMFILARAKEALIDEQLLMATTPPPLSPPSTACRDHGNCYRTWKTVWWGIIAKALLDPKKPLLHHDGVEFVRSTQFSGMTPACKAAAVAHLEENDLFMRAQRQILAQATITVLQECGF